jgi:putative hydrolase of the HAD superfamily
MKTVIFDVYKTLIDVETNENDFKAYIFLANWLTYKGLRIHPEDLFYLYRKTIKEELKSNIEPYPDVEIGEVFKRIINNIDNKRSKKNEKIFVEEISILFRIFITQSLTIKSSLNDVLQNLYKKVRLAIVSNAQRIFTMAELIKFNIAKYFEYMLFSSDIKTCKPNPKIFQKALDDLKIQPYDTIYVGDSLFEDIWGAQTVGLKTVWINYGNSYNIPQNIKVPIPDAEVKIDDYRKLPEIILSML